MQQPYSQVQSDEIDLADLFRSLWNGKWLVIGVSFATLLLAMAYLVLVPRTYTGSFEISALPSSQADVYAEFNASKFMVADEQKLLQLFIDDIKPSGEIRKLIKSYDYIERQADETDQEFESRVAKAASHFSLIPPTPNASKNPQQNWVMNITTQDPKAATQIAFDALAMSNQKVNQQLVDMFNRLAQAHTRNTRFAIEDLDLNKQRAFSNYELVTQAKVKFLREQAQMAREINLSDGALASQSYYNGSTVVNASSQNEPVYLRGYLALEKEIDLLLSRQTPASFIPELPAIEEARLTLEQDRKLVRVQELFAETPIGTEKFVAASYDLAAMEYKSNIKTALVLILAVLLGAMVGVLVLLIHNALIKKP